MRWAHRRRRVRLGLLDVRLGLPLGLVLPGVDLVKLLAGLDSLSRRERTVFALRDLQGGATMTVTTAISTRPEILQNAAERLLGLSADEITRIARELVVGTLRRVWGGRTAEQIGAELEEGEATPIPLNHYLRPPEPGQKAQLDGGRWVCTQCHVAQANAPALVGNRAIDD